MAVTPIFKNIKQESTREKVYASIKDAILAGRLKTGERITEITLASEFNVSRAVIREALQQLAHEGLVEQNSYKGTRVVQLMPQQIDEIIPARVLLEGEIIRQLKPRLTEANKKELKAMARKLESSVNNAQTYAELDFALHERLWDLSGNQTLKKLLTQLTIPLFAMGTIFRYSVLFNQNKIRNRARRGDHIQLIDTICDGTQDEAVRAMQEHIAGNWKQTRENVEELIQTSERSDKKRKSTTGRSVKR